MFSPAVTSGVDLFIYFVIGLISFVAAITAINVRNTKRAIRRIKLTFSLNLVVSFVIAHLMVGEDNGADYRQYKQY